MKFLGIFNKKAKREEGAGGGCYGIKPDYI
jgi:hypothetical protein